MVMGTIIKFDVIKLREGRKKKKRKYTIEEFFRSIVISFAFTFLDSSIFEYINIFIKKKQLGKYV